MITQEVEDLQDKQKLHFGAFGTTDGAVAGIMELRIYGITEATPNYRLQDCKTTSRAVATCRLVVC